MLLLPLNLTSITKVSANSVLSDVLTPGARIGDRPADLGTCDPQVPGKRLRGLQSPEKGEMTSGRPIRGTPGSSWGVSDQRKCCRKIQSQASRFRCLPALLGPPQGSRRGSWGRPSAPHLPKGHQRAREMGKAAVLPSFSPAGRDLGERFERGKTSGH